MPIANQQTILMIHGMSVAGWVWDNYRRFFEQKGYQCLTPTLRYHERDPQDPPHPQLGTTGILDYVDDLEKEVLKCGEKPVLMGHSMGGLIALILGSKGLASSLILLCPAPPAGIPMFECSALKSVRETISTWGFWRKPLRQSYGTVKYAILNMTPIEEGKMLYSKTGYESGRATWEIGFWFLDSRKTTKIDESKIGCPLLVIAGSQDRITPPSVVKKIAMKYSKAANYKEFPDHAHYIIGEPGWEKVTEYIHKWLKEQTGKGDYIESVEPLESNRK